MMLRFIRLESTVCGMYDITDGVFSRVLISSSTAVLQFSKSSFMLLKGGFFLELKNNLC